MNCKIVIRGAAVEQGELGSSISLSSTTTIQCMSSRRIECGITQVHQHLSGQIIAVLLDLTIFYCKIQ